MTGAVPWPGMQGPWGAWARPGTRGWPVWSRSCLGGGQRRVWTAARWRPDLSPLPGRCPPPGWQGMPGWTRKADLSRRSGVPGRPPLGGSRSVATLQATARAARASPTAMQVHRCIYCPVAASPAFFRPVRRCGRVIFGARQHSPAGIAPLSLRRATAPLDRDQSARRPTSRRRFPMRTSSHRPAIGSGMRAGSVTRSPFTVTPPAAIIRRASLFDGNRPASASRAETPPASDGAVNVNPPDDSNSDWSVSRSRIVSDENLASESAIARNVAASPCVRTVMSRASARCLFPACSARLLAGIWAFYHR